MKAIKTVSMLIAVAMAVTAGAGAVRPEKKLKMRIAIEPVNWNDHDSVGSWYVPSEYKAAIHEKLQKKLAESGKCIVIEWQSVEEALKSQEDKTKKAKVVPAQVIVRSRVTEFDMSQASSGGGVNVGNIGRIGGNVTVGKMTLKMKLTSVDTAQIVGEPDATGNASKTGFRFDGGAKLAFADYQAFEKSPLGEATSKAVDDAAKKILAALEKTPWSCRIADYDATSKEITLSAGSEAGVTVGDVFEVHKVTRTVKDDQTGEILGVRTVKVGTIKVTEVDKKFAFAKIETGEGFESGLLVREVEK
jgi:curli biogenesis system outer membrane secretion channel CsgG